MTICYQLTKDEYDELTALQQEPSSLLKQTNANLLDKITSLKAQLEQRTADLSVYVLGNATRHEQSSELTTELTTLVATYNALSCKSIKATVAHTAYSSELTTTEVKQQLKTAVASDLITRTNKNKYLIKE